MQNFLTRSVYLESQSFMFEVVQMQYVDGREYPKVSNYYQDNYRQPVQQDNWSPGDGSYNANSNQYQQENVQDARRSEQVNYKSPPSIQPANEKLDTVNPKHEQDKMAHELKHSKQNMDHGTPIETAKIKIPITSQQEPETHHEQYPDVMAYKMSDADDLHDGFAKTPKGALLSLTIGVIVTCLMAILIGCRLRVVRRRMRRSGKSYAHDADYLVNGMYL